MSHNKLANKRAGIIEENPIWVKWPAASFALFFTSRGKRGIKRDKPADRIPHEPLFGPATMVSPGLARSLAGRGRQARRAPRALCPGIQHGGRQYHLLRLADPDTVRRWADAVPAHFRFSFKFPQTISHQSDLVSADKQVSDFIRLLEPLHDKLGLPAAAARSLRPTRTAPSGGLFSNGCRRRFAMPSRCATPISSPRARRAAVEPAADG